MRANPSAGYRPSSSSGGGMGRSRFEMRLKSKVIGVEGFTLIGRATTG
jgi:hypothetical protein